MPAKVMVARIESGGSKIESDRKFCHCIFHVFTHSDARAWTGRKSGCAMRFVFSADRGGDRAVEIATFALCEILGAGVLFQTCLLTAVPLLITGGIHMDGYLDVTDARHSYGEREKKLAILKDPHTGAFAIIGLGLYLLLYAGAVSELVGADVWLLPGALMLERACSGYSVVAFPKAKKGRACR